ncbi:MAG: AbrB/MazE/SpoVT family DNA-binding domain-containing protein [Oscillospiraceae bacterium]|nr:AbrB/MazE/SpoVT family DNA-binding domain-containing protein [Oscillospiraceae bacterium]
MNIAKISSQGQVTIPSNIRNFLGLKDGDRILFLQRENGEIIIDNASATAIDKAQSAFCGVADELGLPSEEEIQSWVDEARYGKDA